MGVSIRKQRQSAGLAIEELAARLGIPKTELSQYERGWMPPPPRITRDIAVALDCAVSTLLGEETPVEQWQQSPFAAGGPDDEPEAYGDFGFEIGPTKFTFPITVSQRHKLFEWFREHGPGDTEERDREWLEVSTLNNRLLFLNPKALKRAWLRSDDDEATSYFAHPEVYRAVDDYDDGDPDDECGPLLRMALEEHYERVGRETAEAEAVRLYVWDHAGQPLDVELYIHNDEALTSIFALSANSFDVDPGSFVLLDHTAYHVADFFNVGSVSMLSVPLERFLRLSAPEI